MHFFNTLLALALLGATADTAHSATPPPSSKAQLSLYTPTHVVRLMAVALNDRSPFLSAVVTTQGDNLVVANIPNGDPPMAFNVTQTGGFRAQNGKYLYFDPVQLKVRLDSNPHNETQYMSDGSIYTADPPPDLPVKVVVCPGSGNIYTLGFGKFCNGAAAVSLFPIPPQDLTYMWENATEYPSPLQRGWRTLGTIENGTVGDNSTFPLSGADSFSTSGAAVLSIAWCLLTFTLFAIFGI